MQNIEKTVLVPDTAWPSSPAEAIVIQNDLRQRVRLENDFDVIRTIAGVDVGYDPKTNTSRAAIAVLDRETLEPLATAMACLPTTFPYVPGLLSFRELPVLLEALSSLPFVPDLLMVDGQGIAHPRRIGIAAHLGVLTDLPAIGVAKSLLTGKYEEPGSKRGSVSPLTDRDEIIGTVLRSRDGVLPLFISPGHKIDHLTAVRFTLECLTKYRLPEPTRLADKMSKAKFSRLH